ncbi:Ribosomal protein L19 [Mucor velutinosus]|uniref:Ribosomal protein L19 n=1 Tax=Mucor velutinosus TaxID=708070 RepID=A0AAN7I4W9_9FUNG|nr:Ribosomal protein L19 [Mucor velutinosus]
MTRPIPQEVQGSVNALFNQGCSLRAIQKIFPDLCVSVLSRHRKKFLGHSKHAKPGRRSKITTQNMNYIERNLRNGNLDGPKGVQRYLAHMGVQMTLRNIQYILKHKGFKAKRKVKTNFVSAENRKKRLVWAKRHRHLTADDWRKWGFSDETRVNMWGSDGESFYWTDRPTELMPHQTEAKVQGDGGGVVFWGMITAEEPSYGSTITEGTVNSEVYAEILDSSLLDTIEYYGLDKKTFRFQQDNARPHTSGPIKKWFTHHGFSVQNALDWPPPKALT